MRKTLFFVIPLLGLLFVASGTVPAAEDALRAKADSALLYCRAHGMNTDYCMLVDMHAHPGRQRFIVWDFAESRVKISSLCCHGKGGKSTVLVPEFSNTPGSNCTSLGKYRLGERAYSNWGINIHYKMHGLEPTNDNAFRRTVVLHSYTPVPEAEIYPFHLPLGWSEGCPVISDGAMTAVDSLLQQKGKPVLLWIYY